MPISVGPQSHTDYRTLIERGPMLVWRIRADGTPEYFNPSWLAFTGRSLSEELADGWMESVHPDDRLGFRAGMRGFLERQAPFERRYRLRRFDGIYRTLLERAAPIIGEDGSFAGFVGSGVELDDRDAEPTTPSEAEFFQMALDHLCVAGFDGYWKRLNPSWMRTLGWTEEELTSRPLVDFAHPDDRAGVLGGRERLMAGQEMGVLVNRYRCKDGSYRWFEWRSVADPKRGVVYAAARDVTEQREADERLRESKEREEVLRRQLIFADRMASVGTLAGGVAHEINNPLAYLTADLALLGEWLASEEGSAGKDPEPLELVREARHGAERIRQIVRALKTFSSVESEDLRVVDLPSVVELAIEMASNEIRHRARLVKAYGPTPPVLADEARLSQLFVNLLVNAVQAIGEGDAEANEIRVVTSTDPEGRAVVEVRDSGPGIPEKILGRIFDPFFTTKPVGVGTGLGLSTCHSIVASLGGEISATNPAGGGASVRVVLPATKAAPEQSPAPDPKPVEARGRARGSVLVIDDEPWVGKALQRVLAEHEVTVVTSGEEALALLETGRQFQVVFSDVMMPRMSGMELYDELSRRFPEVAPKVVFISGGAFTHGASEFLARTPNALIEKPFEATAIRKLVERLLG